MIKYVELGLQALAAVAAMANMFFKDSISGVVTLIACFGSLAASIKAAKESKTADKLSSLLLERTATLSTREDINALLQRLSSSLNTNELYLYCVATVKADADRIRILQEDLGHSLAMSFDSRNEGNGYFTIKIGFQPPIEPEYIADIIKLKMYGESDSVSNLSLYIDSSDRHSI